MINKLKIAMPLADPGGSGYYRAYLPAKHMQLRKLHDARCWLDKSLSELEKYDMFVLQRAHQPEIMNKVLDMKMKYGSVFVYDLDDDLWSIDEGNPNSSYWTKEIIKEAEDFMGCADAIVVSTEHLKGRVYEETGLTNIYVVPNYVEDAYFAPYPMSKGKIRIGWAGGNSHANDFRETGLADVLRRLKEVYGEKLEVIMMGWCPDELIGLVEFYASEYPTKYLHKLYDLRLDIGLIPCANNLFNKSKSIVKLLEYGLVGIPIVACSASGPYKNIVFNNPIDVKVLGDGNWKRYLNELIEMMLLFPYLDKEDNFLRSYVRSNFLIEDHIYEIVNIYERIYKEAKG